MSGEAAEPPAEPAVVASLFLRCRECREYARTTPRRLRKVRRCTKCRGVRRGDVPPPPRVANRDGPV